jgi:hypothetical protein
MIAAVATLILAAAGGMCFGWVGVLGGLVLAFGLWVAGTVLNALAVLIECLLNPLGRG